MKIRNVSPLGALDVPLLGEVVEAGASVDAPDEIAERLLEQTDNWAAVAAEDEEAGR